MRPPSVGVDAVLPDLHGQLFPQPLPRETNFKAAVPNQIWPADLTYIPTREGCLAAILDMHTRKIVGWSMRQTLHPEIALDAPGITRLDEPQGRLRGQRPD